MKTTIKRAVIILFFFLINDLMAQTAKDDFKKINSAYANASFLSLRFIYKIYAGPVTMNLVEKADGEIKKKGNYIYTKLGGTESVKNDHYAVVVDHYDKLIYLSSVNNEVDKNKKSQNEQMLFNIDKTFSMCEKSVYQAVDKQTAKYTIQCPSAEYEKVEIEFNKKSFFISKMVLYYKDEQEMTVSGSVVKSTPRLEISYDAIDISGKGLSSEWFTYDRFVKMNNGNYSCKDQFKKYKLINQLSNIKKTK